MDQRDGLLRTLLTLLLVLGGFYVMLGWNSKKNWLELALLPTQKLFQAISRPLKKVGRRLITAPARFFYRGARRLGRVRHPWILAPFAWLSAAALWILGLLLSIPPELIGVSVGGDGKKK